jgi:Xaa-Pro aminopeptidase
VRAGVTERHIALELEFFMRREGSEGVAFDPIVASGPNSALPHAKVTDRVLATGDFVKMDFGARIGGYCADMTRTVIIGTASTRQVEIYEAVLSANLAGIEAVEAGRPGRSIDATARAVIESAGMGSLFGHGLGHGVGREVHELPGVGPRSSKAVPLGSVITIEPGVYVEGFGGVRIEDLIVVERSGARVLSRSPKNLIEL